MLSTTPNGHYADGSTPQKGSGIERPKRKRVTVTIISGPVKPVDYHPDASQPTAAYSASVVDFFEASCRQSSESEGTGKEAAIGQGHRKAVFWLISLAALIPLLVGVVCLMESVTPRTAGTDQRGLAAEGAPSPAGVTFGEAVQALGVRH